MEIRHLSELGHVILLDQLIPRSLTRGANEKDAGLLLARFQKLLCHRLRQGVSDAGDKDIRDWLNEPKLQLPSYCIRQLFCKENYHLNPQHRLYVFNDILKHLHLHKSITELVDYHMTIIDIISFRNHSKGKIDRQFRLVQIGDVIYKRHW